MKKRKRMNGEGSLYIETRGGRKYYRAQVVVGINADGSYKRRSVSGYNKQEVLKKMKTLQYQSDHGYINEKENQKFQDFFHDWIFNVKKIEISEASFQSYYTEYDVRIKNSALGRKPVEKIKKMDVQRYVKNLLENGTSVYMTKRSLQFVRSCLQTACDNGIFIANPSDGVKIPKQRENEKEKINTLKKEEQEKLISALENNDIDKMIFLALHTGMRLSELIALRWEDFDGENISVNKQLRYVAEISEDGEKKWAYKETPPKTSTSYRTIPLPKETVKILKRHHLQQMETKLKSGRIFNPENFIFTDKGGNHIESKRPNRRLGKLCEDIGITKITFHGLRHTYATRLFENGISPKVVQSLLGHTNINITLDTYTHVFDDIKNEKINAVAHLLHTPANF